ncbi:polysaccharide biosynthesis protein [Aeromicrobium endophyticum]|uniref:Polysaccharide biosynthesis protein n=2 Tax=Aeromicrobium endophyticum TaxID=2292704 RepID=A0A371P321_9ACTN|nr:polysaccharide biosynthesis protein [Aeromicrobium endophyticum]
MNIAVYGFNIVAARILDTRDLGALTALFGILLVGTVAAFGLQATTARRIATSPQEVDQIIGASLRLTMAVAAGVGLAVAASSIGLTPALKLSSYWPVVLAGAALVPLTIMGTLSGIAQGQSRWGTLTAIYLGNGVGRLVGGTVAMLIDPSPTSAMVGIAIGSWLPIVAGAPLMIGHWTMAARGTGRHLLREVTMSTHALLAYFVLSNMDALIARNRLGEHDSGLYASGLILAKAALFLPQFVSVVLFPDLARSTDDRARLRAVSIVAGMGALAVAATVALPDVAQILTGGSKYAEVSDRLWLFAVSGSSLAIVHLLVFDALARRAHGIVVMIWVAVAAVLAITYGVGVGLTGLVVTMATVSAALAVVVYAAPVLGRDTADRLG